MLVQGGARRTLGRASSTSPAGSPRRRDATASAPGDRIAFLDRNGMAYFDFLFGGALIGAVNVAVNWRLAPAEMAAIIDDSGATVLAVHADYLPALAEMPSDLPAVRRIVVVGDRADSALPTRVRRLRRLGRGLLGRRPGPCRDARRGEHAALHVGHHGPAEGRHADQRQPVDRHLGSRARPSTSGRHGQPGRHAPVPHRRFGLGAVCHVPRRPVDHPARDVDPAPAARARSPPSGSPRCSSSPPSSCCCWPRRRSPRPTCRACG